MFMKQTHHTNAVTKGFCTQSRKLVGLYVIWNLIFPFNPLVAWDTQGKHYYRMRGRTTASLQRVRIQSGREDFLHPQAAPDRKRWSRMKTS